MLTAFKTGCEADQERSMGQARQHIPYRNSMMTTALRDSLGGNCRTVMIANITGDSGQLDESISTCRFAQRVAMVSNTVCRHRLSRRWALGFRMYQGSPTRYACSAFPPVGFL